MSPKERATVMPRMAAYMRARSGFRAYGGRRFAWGAHSCGFDNSGDAIDD